MLNLSKVKDEVEFLSLATLLCENNFVIVGNVKKAVEIGRHCEKLVSLVERKLGSQNKLTLLAKEQLATNYAFQGRYEEASQLVEKILPAIKAEFGDGSDEEFSILGNFVFWCKNLGRISESEILDQAQIDKHRRLHPICEHLRPVEDYLQSRGVKTWRRTCPSRGNWADKVQVNVDAWLDLDSIRRRLQLDSCVENLEWPEMKSDSFRGFSCSIHNHQIGGPYEQNSKWPNVS